MWLTSSITIAASSFSKQKITPIDSTKNSCLQFVSGNNMICSNIWYKYHEWYFEIVTHNLRQFWNITCGLYAKYHVQIMLLFVYATTRNGFVIFTCRYFKLNWNTTALSQSNCRNNVKSLGKQLVLFSRGTRHYVFCYIFRLSL